LGTIIRVNKLGFNSMKALVFLGFTLLSFTSYSQCISGDCENGYGKYNCECGYVYEGDFVNGEKVKGTLTKSNLVYTGEFENDVANGSGVIKYIDGSWYEGTFVDNLPDGYGTYYFAKGQKFIGQLKQGVFEGYGVQVFSRKDGSIIETQIGSFKKDQLDGMGVSVSGNGDIYFGEFLNGKYWGFGLFVFANDKYPEAGEFRKMKLKKNVVLRDYPSSGSFGVNGLEVENMLFYANGDYQGKLLEIKAVNKKGEEMNVFYDSLKKELYLSKFGNDSLGTIINIQGEITEGIPNTRIDKNIK